MKPTKWCYEGWLQRFLNDFRGQPGCCACEYAAEKIKEFVETGEMVLESDRDEIEDSE